MPPDNEVALKSFEYAKDLSQLLITIGTGIITVSITFTKDILAGQIGKTKSLLFSSWILFLLSILFGIIHIMTLTGGLDSYTSGKLEIKNNSRLFMSFQFFLFLFGLLLMIIYGIRNLKKISK